MEKRILGNTGIVVSELCFGSLTISPLQANLDLTEGSNIIKYAFNKGINFIDTAEIYENYNYIKNVLKTVKRRELVIATKSYSYSKETAEKSLNKALRDMETDYIDIFLLHEQESEHTIRGHYEAIEYFIKAKEKGIIRAIGISTHRIEAVEAANKYNEIEIIHPIINRLGIGIQDGTSEEMVKALEVSYRCGKGIYGMKPLGGGHLIKNVEESIDYVRKVPYLHSFAIGMQSKDEVDANVSLVEKGFIPTHIKKKINKKDRRLKIADWCIGCGQCVKTCNNGGIKIIDNKAVPIMENCVLCGYCARKCPEFCIKVI